ncbi:Telomerase reverse transcriptase [Bienertia sinuspersici]
MKKRKPGRVPNVLWRQFKDRSASLSNTILSLIPKTCNCNSMGKCLYCVFGNGDEASMSYLVRPNDSSEYLHLMSTCFVAVPHDAPPLSPFTIFTRHWSQTQIVERAIQASLRKDNVSPNVICHGYQKELAVVERTWGGNGGLAFLVEDDV